MVAPTYNPQEWATVPESGSRPAYSLFKQQIETSPHDDRTYRIIRLENGLEAILVSDPQGDKAAASLDVAVGHLSDPDDMPGLAHFCEHLLFMGTEQFPGENEYSEYLAKHSGNSNAYTATSNTNYHFAVGPPALSGALERFAGFFHSPLFAPSCTTRELNAVDSEHKKNHQNDMWRVFQVNKHLARPGHVWSKFGSGNRETLERAARGLKKRGLLAEAQPSAPVGNRVAALSTDSMASSRVASPTPSEMEADGGAVGRETRRRLIEWWAKEYCASRMRLAVVGKESLDELTEMVVPLFAPIKNRQSDPLPMFLEFPYGPDEEGALISIQTIMDIHAIDIHFPLEWQPPHWRHSPSSFLSHLVGHEGPGSLHAYLKKKGWITSLSSGAQNSARGFAIFRTTIQLTQLGFLHQRDIVLATFKYLSLLRSSNLEAWRQDEISLLSRTRFHFQEKSHAEKYATWLAEHLSWPLPREKILSGPVESQPWSEDGSDKAVVLRTLNSFRIDKCRALLMARKEEFTKLPGGLHESEWKTEPIYGTSYRVEKWDQELAAEAERLNDVSDLFLPGKNLFIPTNLDVSKKDIVQPSKRPFLVRRTSHSELWHKKDDQFWVPKMNAIMQIISPQANLSARHSVLSRVWVELITDSLNEFAYDADLAGLSYSVTSDMRGLTISISGYNDKLPVLARQVLERVRRLEVEPERLAVILEQTKRNWQNVFLNQTYTISNYFMGYLLTESFHTILEKLKEIDTITAEEIEKHAQVFLSKAFVEMLVVGNVSKEDAIALAETSEKILAFNPISPDEVPERALLIKEGSNYVWQMPVPNPNEPNSSITYFLYIGSANHARTRVTASLLSQIFSEPAFNVLRTQEQLGYVVACGQIVLSRDTHVGIRVIVQSERKPAYLEERVEAFLTSMKAKIEGMGDAEFAEQKAGLARKWLEKPKRIREEAQRFSKYIEAGHLDFFRRDNDAKLLEEITKADVLALYAAKIDPSSSTRAKVSIHMASQKPRPKRFSSAAMDAFDAALQDAGVVEVEWRRAVGGGETESPLLSAVEGYWRAHLPADKMDGLLAKLGEAAKSHPSDADYEGTLRPDVELISDVAAFKAGLQVAADPTPVVDWGDLPPSKL